MAKGSSSSSSSSLAKALKSALKKSAARRSTVWQLFEEVAPDQTKEEFAAAIGKLLHSSSRFTLDGGDIVLVSRNGTSKDDHEAREEEATTSTRSQSTGGRAVRQPPLGGMWE